MEQLSVFDVLGQVFGFINSSHLLLVMFGFFIMVLGTSYLNRQVHRKSITILIFLSWCCFFGAVLSLVLSIFSNVFISFVQEVLMQIYFPGFAMMAFIFIVTYFLGISSFFLAKSHQVLARLNQVMFCFLNLLYAALIYQIVYQKLDLSLGILLYKNTTFLSILECISFSFLIWLLFLLLPLFASFVQKSIITPLLKKDQNYQKTPCYHIVIVGVFL